MPMQRLVKEKGKVTVDAQQAEVKEKERVRIGVIQSAVRFHENALIPQEVKAETRPRIIVRNALLSAGASAQIATRIAIAATHPWMQKISRSVMHGRRSAIVKAKCPMPCRQRTNVDLS